MNPNVLKVQVESSESGGGKPSPSSSSLGTEAVNNITSAVEDLAKQVEYFRTAKGSLYEAVGESTTRIKSDHSNVGHDKGDTGLKTASLKTIYVDNGRASALSAAGLSNGDPSNPVKARVLIHDGRATLVTWDYQRNGWGAAPSSRGVPYSTKPEVGLSPLELWQPRKDVPGFEEAYSGMHAGNAISEMMNTAEGKAAFDEARRQQAANAQSNPSPVPTPSPVPVPTPTPKPDIRQNTDLDDFFAGIERPVKRPKPFTEVEQRVFDLDAALADIVSKVKRGTVNQAEAAALAAETGRKAGMGGTEALRAEGRIGLGDNASTFAVRSILNGLREAGIPIEVDGIASKPRPRATEVPRIDGRMSDAEGWSNSAKQIAIAKKEIADVIAKYAAGFLTKDEAEALLQARTKGTLDQSVALRQAGIIGQDETAADYLRRKANDAAKKSGVDDLDLKTPPKHDKNAMERYQRLEGYGNAARNLASGSSMSQKVAGVTELAGTGALGSRAAALAGGPAGAAVAVGALALDMMKDGIKAVGAGVRGAIDTATTVTRHAAARDGQAAFSTGANSLADSVESIPLLGIAATGATQALKTFTHFIDAGRSAVDAFAARASQISMYDSRIATAKAELDANRMLQDIRDAQMNGEQHAKMIEAQGQVERAWGRAVDPLRLKLANIVETKIAPTLIVVAEMVERASVAAEMTMNIVEELARRVFPGIAGGLDVIAGAAKAREEARRQKEAADGAMVGMAAIQEWFDGLERMRMGGGANDFADAVGGALAGAMMIPVLKRM